MKKYFCSADEYQSIINSQNGVISISKKCLTYKPGTVPYEAHKRYDATAWAYGKALEAFTVRDGSVRSPDGSITLSPQFQADLSEFFASLVEENEQSI